MGYPVLPLNTSFARNLRRMIPESILNSMDNTCLERPAGDRTICGPRCHTNQEHVHAVGTTCTYIHSLLRHQDLEDAKHGSTIRASNYPIKQKACTRLVGERVFSTRRSRDFQRGSDPGQRAAINPNQRGGTKIAWIHRLHIYTRNQISWPRALRGARVLHRR